jgi:hypothetical protein
MVSLASVENLLDPAGTIIAEDDNLVRRYDDGGVPPIVAIGVDSPCGEGEDNKAAPEVL